MKKFLFLVVTIISLKFEASSQSNNAFPVIGVGGIHSPEDAIEKIKAGADLIQLYTGFIYEGPALIKKINKELIHQNIL